MGAGNPNGLMGSKSDKHIYSYDNNESDTPVALVEKKAFLLMNHSMI